jgi:hypothetical protein
MDNNKPYASDLLQEFTPQQQQENRLRDEALYVLAQTSGWAELQKIIDQYLESLKSLNIDPKDSVETVGYKYLASVTAKTYLEAVKDIVNGTYQAIEADRK